MTPALHTFEDASSALPHLLDHLLTHGEEVGSRGGERVLEAMHQHITLTTPVQREILTPERKASLPAQIAETMWILSGRDDVAWLERYLPRAGQFSDDGVRWRGGYGPRLRRWERRGDMYDVFDQVAYVVDLLNGDRTSRRAVITLYDPDVDSAPGKDVPCNNWLHFTSRLGRLDLHVATRSNDLMWGWSGINAFEWSVLQEVIAGLLGIEVGSLHFSISSLHLYDRHWARGQRIAKASGADHAAGLRPSPRFDATVVDRNLDKFYLLVDRWMKTERGLREGTVQVQDVLAFPEPMLRSWLCVIGWHWTKDDAYLAPIRGTRLHQALLASPAVKPAPERQPEDPFAQFATNLHKEKHAAYGDSWKRRGETIGILANIARKVDRLGVDGAGDSTTDTAVDLLIYLIKYRLWLSDHDPDVAYPSVVDKDLLTRGTASDHHSPVAAVLQDQPPLDGAVDIIALETGLRVGFNALECSVEERDGMAARAIVVDGMIQDANVLARRLYAIDQWKTANATRFWKGYDK